MDYTLSHTHHHSPSDWSHYVLPAGSSRKSYTPGSITPDNTGWQEAQEAVGGDTEAK